MRKLFGWKEVLPRQLTGSLTDLSQAPWVKTDLLRFFDGRFVMVNPGEVTHPLQSNHRVHRQAKVDHVDGLPRPNGIERKTVPVGDGHRLAVGEGMSYDGRRALPVKVRFMVKTLHRCPVMPLV